MTVRSSTSTQIVTSTAVTGVKPSGSVAGDRLLVWLVVDGSSSVITPPAGEGWALLATASTAAPADVNKAFLYEKKVSDGAETYAFVNSASKSGVIQVIALTGRHASSAAIVGTPTITNTAAASPLSVAIGGVTALFADDVLWFGQIDQTIQTDTWSFGAISGYTQLQNDANAKWVTAAAFAAENVAGGATGTLTSTATRLTGTGNGSRSGVVVAIPTGAANPTVSTVSSNSATEGSTITHTVTLSGATIADTNYAATLVGVNATGSGTDFTSDLASATYSNGVTFSGGNMVVPTTVSSFTVTIATTADTTDEDNETYTLTVGGVSGTGTITDDDAPPTVSISDATESFGTVTHTLTLSQASSKTITVQVDSANGSKTAGTHYTAITAQTVTFNPGETEQTVVVTVL